MKIMNIGNSFLVFPAMYTGFVLTSEMYILKKKKSMERERSINIHVSVSIFS